MSNAQPPDLATCRTQRAAMLKAAMRSAEADQERSARECLLALLAGTAPPANAVARLQALDARLTQLRATLAAFDAAQSQAALDAITWTP